eukprot:937658-Prymnesium_polylepis.1
MGRCIGRCRARPRRVWGLVRNALAAAQRVCPQRVRRQEAGLRTRDTRLLGSPQASRRRKGPLHRRAVAVRRGESKLSESGGRGGMPRRWRCAAIWGG